jgi:deoxyribodipyrimidine photo-lyase
MRCVWFREDLRVDDNLALNYAAQSGPVWGLFLITHDWWDRHGWGSNKRAALFTALESLASDLSNFNIPLIIKNVTGALYHDQVEIVLQTLATHHTNMLYFNRQYELHETDRDRLLAKKLLKQGGHLHVFDDLLLYPPGSIRTASNTPFTVFTPFKKKALASVDQKIMQGPKLKKQQELAIKSDLSSLVKVKPDSPDLFKLPITTIQAKKRLEFFAEEKLHRYDLHRNFPCLDGTSKLSVALSLGSLSIRQLWNDIERQPDSLGKETYQSELLWREFYKHILIDFPDVCRYKPFKKQYELFDWNDNNVLLQAWKEGLTGYPIVDAGMRQLRQEGWMHNRVRMICAMFLTKLLLQSWQKGEQEFAYWLADYDLAANNGGWQWSSSTGTDAVPYFRIFSPWSQTERFDPDGEYIKRYIPELESLSGLHLSSAEKLGKFSQKGYPKMIKDYHQARQECLDAFKKHEQSR